MLRLAIQCLGFRAQVWGSVLGLAIQGLGVRVQGSGIGFGVQFKIRVQGVWVCRKR